MRRHHQSLSDIITWIIASYDFLLLKQSLGTLFHIILKDRRRCGHRSVGKVERDSVKFGIGTHTSGIGWLTEVDVIVSRAVPARHADFHQSSLALLDDEKFVENREALNHHVFAMGNDLGPIHLFSVLDGSAHNLVIARPIGISLDIEMPAIMVDAIKHIGLTLLKDAKIVLRLVALKNPTFRRQGGFRVDNQIFPRFRLANVAHKSLVRFAIDLHIFSRIGAKSMPHDLTWPQSLVFHAIKQCLVVAGPDQVARSVFDRFANELSCHQIFDKNRVNPSTHRIDGISQQTVVLAQADFADVEKRMAFSQLVAI